VQTAFSIVMLALVILFYLSNPRMKVNQWFFAAGIFFWLGVVKQAIMFEIIPLLHNTLGLAGLDSFFSPIHSLLTWVIYTLALPTTTIGGLYFGYVDKTHPHYLRWLMPAMYVPGLVITFFYNPLLFGVYQLDSLPFWITYSAYNLIFAAVLTLLAARGSRIDRRKGAQTKQKNQRKRVALVLLPSLYYWFISIFIPRLVERSDLFDLWQLGVFIMIVSICVFIVSALKDGFMGLRLVSQNYNWNTSTSLMGLINMNAEYANHFLKTQITNMNLSMHLLREHCSEKEMDAEAAEYLNILERSISSIEGYFDRVRSHSQIIRLKDEAFVRITDMLEKAALAALNKRPGVAVHVGIEENVSLLCDGVHMTEVFNNILTNAAEAMGENGIIEVYGKSLKSKYQLFFKDNGSGIDKDVINDIFDPLISTKNKDKNSGLGLTYCKNVIIEHGGGITAKSAPGEGTTVIITFPARRVKIVPALSGGKGRHVLAGRAGKAPAEFGQRDAETGNPSAKRENCDG